MRHLDPSTAMLGMARDASLMLASRTFGNRAGTMQGVVGGLHYRRDELTYSPTGTAGIRLGADPYEDMFIVHRWKSLRLDAGPTPLSSTEYSRLGRELTLTAPISPGDRFIVEVWSQNVPSAAALVSSLSDPHWAYVTSLLNFGGADGSTTFTDEKSIAWTPAGNAQIDTSLGFNAGQFDGSGDRLSALGTNTGLQLSNAAPWTVDFLVRTNGTSAYQIIGNLNDQDGTGHYWIILNSTFTGLHTVQFGVQGAAYKFGTATLGTGAMKHIELGFDGSNIRCFLDGTQLGSTQSLGSIASNTREILIGSGWNNVSGYTPYNLDGWIQAIRITKGVCRHTANFTPPSAPFSTS